jgi:long-chain fatty acid transport protein
MPMGKKTFILFASLFMILGSCYLEASRFRNFELGARAATLGGAFVARADDVSAVFYNPAGLAFLSGIRIKTNIHFLTQTLTAEYPGSPRSFESTPFHLRGSHFISLNIKNRISFGIGGFTPESMETKWPQWSNPWPGHSLSINSKLNTFCIRPVLAVNISNILGVGVGMDFIFSDALWLYDRISFFHGRGSGLDRDVSSKSEVSGKGLGFVAGILIRINDSLQVGGRYHPKVKLDLEGLTDLNIADYWEPEFFWNQEVRSAFTIPQEFVLGFMYSPSKSLNFQLDIQWNEMSKIKHWEFNLDPQFYEEFEDFYGFIPYYARQGVDLNLRNTWRIMFGTEYYLSDFIALRAGYAYQKSAVNGQMLHPVFPDLDSNILSLGVGYEGPIFSFYNTDERIGGFSFDVYFQYGFSPSCTSTLTEFPAAYKASRWIIGVGVGFNFGSL